MNEVRQSSRLTNCSPETLKVESNQIVIPEGKGISAPCTPLCQSVSQPVIISASEISQNLTSVCGGGGGGRQRLQATKPGSKRDLKGGDVHLRFWGTTI